MTVREEYIRDKELATASENKDIKVEDNLSNVSLVTSYPSSFAGVPLAGSGFEGALKKVSKPSSSRPSQGKKGT